MYNVYTAHKVRLLSLKSIFFISNFNRLYFKHFIEKNKYCVIFKKKNPS